MNVHAYPSIKYDIQLLYSSLSCLSPCELSLMVFAGDDDRLQYHSLKKGQHHLDTIPGLDTMMTPTDVLHALDAGVGKIVREV